MCFLCVLKKKNMMSMLYILISSLLLICWFVCVGQRGKDPGFVMIKSLMFGK